MKRKVLDENQFMTLERVGRKLVLRLKPAFLQMLLEYETPLVRYKVAKLRYEIAKLKYEIAKLKVKEKWLNVRKKDKVTSRTTRASGERSSKKSS